MSNRDHLVDGLHSVLSGLWEGSDKRAQREFRELMDWSVRTVKSSVPTYRAGTFPGPVLEDAPQDQAATNVPLTVVVNWQSALKK